MKYLLDTHTLLWFVDGNARLSPTARTQIRDLNNVCFISSVSLWEIAIKFSSGKLNLPQPFDELVSAQLKRDEITVLPISTEHLLAVANLPFPSNGHRDPFDRMIACQAQAEDLTLVSADSVFDTYGVNRLW